MKVEELFEVVAADFYTGVPDSQLKALGDYLMSSYGIDQEHHMIAANEGNAVALATGYHLATGKIPVVYLQNSGEGNIINPVTSLLSEQVYAIPMVFLIGWRGEPGIEDEVQHVCQGKVTIKLLDDINIKSFIINQETTKQELEITMEAFKDSLLEGRSVAFVIGKGALSYAGEIKYTNNNQLSRETVIEQIVNISKDDPIISTTGKASRELFEIRQRRGQEHKYDFLTVGSMGHSSSIALGVAINKPEVKLWCIDGDGALLMHMGAMAIIGANKPRNLIHVIINNEAHESVGGLPTVGKDIDIAAIAKACGYPNTSVVNDISSLERALRAARACEELSLIEVKCSLAVRNDLSRPTISTLKSKQDFMAYLQSLK